YGRLRKQDALDHTQAVRAVLTRILVAPAFLYRAEQPPDQAGIVVLSDWELASRLSFLVWSSLPDDELRRAAAAGELRNPKQLAHQVAGLPPQPQAQAVATRVFGQLVRFYQFQPSRGGGQQRFSEFRGRAKPAL